MLLRPHLVQGGPHKAEVLLGGVGAAEALGGGPVGHIIEKALARGPNDRDHVGPLPGGGLGLDDILVDVARGHDDIEVWSLLVTVLGKVGVPLSHVTADALHAGFRRGFDGGPDLVEAVGGHLGKVQLAFVHGLGDLLGREPRLRHGVAQGVGRAVGQQALFEQMVHHHVGQGHAHLVHPVDEEQAADSPFHGDRGVPVDEGLGVHRHLTGGSPGPIHLMLIQIQLGCHYFIRSSLNRPLGVMYFCSTPCSRPATPTLLSLRLPVHTGQWQFSS